jgi:hypothetical protein
LIDILRLMSTKAIEILTTHYKTVEARKSIQNKTPSPLRVFQYAMGVSEKRVDPEELASLQIYAEPKPVKGALDPTFEIFELLSSTKAAEVAGALDFLRERGSPAVQRWLTSINDSLAQIILGGNCPAIITTKRRVLHCGNIPDGNHRLLSALSLSDIECVPSIPVIEIDMNRVDHFIYNAILLFDRWRHNPKGTVKLVKERLRGT